MEDIIYDKIIDCSRDIKKGRELLGEIDNFCKILKEHKPQMQCDLAIYSNMTSFQTRLIISNEDLFTTLSMIKNDYFRRIKNIELEVEALILRDKEGGELKDE